MSKKTIMRRAAESTGRMRQASPAKPGEDCEGRARTGLESLGDGWDDRLAAKIADAVCSRLARLLPLVARLAAADTIHTSEQPATVMGHAIKEGLEATEIIKRVGGNA